jgi:hypothetical protein
MANKYVLHSSIAQARVHKELEVEAKRKACNKKKAFNSFEEAYQKGQQTYKCPFCRKWHRSGKIIRLRNRLIKREENVSLATR